MAEGDHSICIERECLNEWTLTLPTIEKVEEGQGLHTVKCLQVGLQYNSYLLIRVSISHSSQLNMYRLIKFSYAH